MRDPISLVVEGTTDEAIAKRLLAEARLGAGPVYVKQGRDALDRSLAGYDNAARFSCWLVLRDLDRDAVCAPGLHRRLLRRPARHMRLHIVVHAIEAWLLADDEALSRALVVARSRIPRDPESVQEPKSALVDVARHSRSRAIREALVPAPNSTARVGPGHAAFLAAFAVRDWRPAVAARRSRSLAKLREFLRTVARSGGSC
jgi:hypothetical protein